MKILVGPDKQPFIIHRELLCETSSYFAAALQGEFKEAKEQRIEMLEEDVAMFQSFQIWLYSDNILTTNTRENWKILFDLHIFGDARGIPHLQNAAVDALINKEHRLKWIPAYQFKYVYEDTSEKSPLRRLLVDWTASLSAADWFTEDKFEWYGKRFLFDMAMAQYEMRKGVKKVITDFRSHCEDYHVSIGS